MIDRKASKAKNNTENPSNKHIKITVFSPFTHNKEGNFTMYEIPFLLPQSLPFHFRVTVTPVMNVNLPPLWVCFLIRWLLPSATA